MQRHLQGPRAPVTISISFVRDMLAGPAEPAPSAAAITAILAQAGIAEALLHHDGARVTGAQYTRLFRSLCDHRNDECLGFLSRPFKRGSYALVAHAALSAQDLRHALQNVATTFRILQDDLTLELVTRRQQAGLTLRFDDNAAPGHRFLHLFVLRSLWRLFDWLTGGALHIAHIDLAFAAPPDADSYREFFLSPRTFGQPRTAFWFDARQLQAPVRVDEHALRDFLNDPQFSFAQLNNEVVSTRVRTYLHQSKPDWPDLATTALALGMSTAALQRNLAKEGSSFQALKDKLRRDIAITCLSTTNMTLTQLAAQLGFSESANFQRAFKAWTGSAAGSYRRGPK